MIAWLRQDVKEPNELFKRTDSRKWVGLPIITNSNSTPPIPLHFSNEHQRSSHPKQSDTSSLQQAAKMGEVKTPRQWFLWSVALVYVCAFASIYVQIPGREVSLFFFFFADGCLAVMVDSGCGSNEWLRLHLNLNCVVECRWKQNNSFGSFIHSLALIARCPAKSCHEDHSRSSAQTFQGPRAQTAFPFELNLRSGFNV